MKIPPTGPQIPPSGGPAGSTEARSGGRAEFPKRAAGEAPPGRFAGIAAKHTRADLQDPAKLDQALSEAMGQMLDGKLGEMGVNLPAAQRGKLLDFLRADPMLRAQVQKMLEGAVK